MNVIRTLTLAIWVTYRIVQVILAIVAVFLIVGPFLADTTVGVAAIMWVLAVLALLSIITLDVLAPDSRPTPSSEES